MGLLILPQVLILPLWDQTLHRTQHSSEESAWDPPLSHPLPSLSLSINKNMFKNKQQQQKKPLDFPLKSHSLEAARKLDLSGPSGWLKSVESYSWFLVRSWSQGGERHPMGCNVGLSAQGGVCLSLSLHPHSSPQSFFLSLK